MESESVILNGKLFPVEDAHISIQSRAIAYGDGCFTTLKSYQNRFLHFTQHVERLNNGLQYLGINLQLDANEILSQVRLLLSKNKQTNCEAVVRIQCFRKGGRGYFNISDEGEYIISSSKFTESEQNVELSTVPVRAIPNECLARQFKLSNSINYIKAAQQAKAKGAHDGLMWTINDDISETTISNIFWIKGDTVYTPSEDCDLLPGISRSIVLQLLEDDRSLSIEEGKYSSTHLLHADAVFCTNSVRELYEVHKIDSSEFTLNHPVFVKINNAFQNYKTQHIK